MRSRYDCVCLCVTRLFHQQRSCSIKQRIQVFCHFHLLLYVSSLSFQVPGVIVSVCLSIKASYQDYHAIYGNPINCILQVDRKFIFYHSCCCRNIERLSCKFDLNNFFILHAGLKVYGAEYKLLYTKNPILSSLSL